MSLCLLARRYSFFSASLANNGRRERQRLRNLILQVDDLLAVVVLFLLFLHIILGVAIRILEDVGQDLLLLLLGGRWTMSSFGIVL